MDAAILVLFMLMMGCGIFGLFALVAELALMRSRQNQQLKDFLDRWCGEDASWRHLEDK